MHVKISYITSLCLSLHIGKIVVTGRTDRDGFGNAKAQSLVHNQMVTNVSSLPVGMLVREIAP